MLRTWSAPSLPQGEGPDAGIAAELVELHGNTTLAVLA